MSPSSFPALPRPDGAGGLPGHGQGAGNMAAALCAGFDLRFARTKEVVYERGIDHGRGHAL